MYRPHNNETIVKNAGITNQVQPPHERKKEIREIKSKLSSETRLCNCRKRPKRLSVQVEKAKTMKVN